MSFDAIAEALGNADVGNERQDFFDERGRLIRKFREFAKLTAKELGEKIEASASWVKHAETQASPLSTKYSEPLCDVLGVPHNAMKGPNSFQKFCRKHPTWCKVMDAVLEYYPEGDEEECLFPTEFIIKTIGRSGFNNLDDWSDYLENPVDTNHPDERKLTDLEEALGLPVGTLLAPQKIRDARASTNLAIIEARNTFVSNVEAQLQSRKMNWIDLASKAGLSKDEVYRIRDSKTLSIRSAAAIAKTLDEPLGKLLMTNGEFIEHLKTDKTFSNVPPVARKLVSDYISIIRRTSDKDHSSASAQALLVMTPLLGAMLREFARQISPSKFPDSTSVFTLLNTMANAYTSELKQ
jgi:transcriptional regulator with XRE-family HTH domain